MTRPGTEAYPLAARWRRLLATMIDAVLVPGATIFLVMVTDVMEDAEDYQDNWWMLWVFLQAVSCYLVLNGYLLWRRGQTLGKLILGIAVVPAFPLNSDDQSPSFAFIPAPWWKLIFVRALFFPLMFVAIVPPLAPVPMLDLVFIFSKQRRCLHDLAAGTVVIHLSTNSSEAKS